MLKKKPLIFRYLAQKKVFYLLLIILVLVFYAFFKETRRNYEVRQELGDVESELKSLQSRHGELLDLVDYFKSESYIELEARDKLGLMKEGEKVAVITDLEATSTIDSLWGSQQENTNEELSNVHKWWQYFFAVKN